MIHLKLMSGRMVLRMETQGGATCGSSQAYTMLTEAAARALECLPNQVNLIYDDYVLTPPSLRPIWEDIGVGPPIFDVTAVANEGRPQVLRDVFEAWKDLAELTMSALVDSIRWAVDLPEDGHSEDSAASGSAESDTDEGYGYGPRFEVVD